jgi:hypothetical protein
MLLVWPLVTTVEHINDDPVIIMVIGSDLICFDLQQL